MSLASPPETLLKQGPWPLEVTSEAPLASDHPLAVAGATLGQVYRLSTRSPVDGATLTLELITGTGTEQTLAAYLAAGDANTGHTYAWDYVVSHNGEVHLISAGCVWSETSFTAMRNQLDLSLQLPADAPRVLCRCGFGCAQPVLPH